MIHSDQLLHLGPGGVPVAHWEGKCDYIALTVRLLPHLLVSVGPLLTADVLALYQPANFLFHRFSDVRLIYFQFTLNNMICSVL